MFIHYDLITNLSDVVRGSYRLFPVSNPQALPSMSKQLWGHYGVSDTLEQPVKVVAACKLEAAEPAAKRARSGRVKQEPMATVGSGTTPTAHRRGQGMAPEVVGAAYARPSSKPTEQQHGGSRNRSDNDDNNSGDANGGDGSDGGDGMDDGTVVGQPQPEGAFQALALSLNGSAGGSEVGGLPFACRGNLAMVQLVHIYIYIYMPLSDILHNSNNSRVAVVGGLFFLSAGGMSGAIRGDYGDLHFHRDALSARRQLRGLMESQINYVRMTRRTDACADMCVCVCKDGKFSGITHWAKVGEK